MLAESVTSCSRGACDLVIVQVRNAHDNPEVHGAAKLLWLTQLYFSYTHRRDVLTISCTIPILDLLS